MEINEETIRFLEGHIPELAESAIRQAYWHALASGSSVLECNNGFLVEICPNGKKKIIKSVQSKIPIALGQRLEIP